MQPKTSLIFLLVFFVAPAAYGNEEESPLSEEVARGNEEASLLPEEGLRGNEEASLVREEVVRRNEEVDDLGEEGAYGNEETAPLVMPTFESVIYGTSMQRTTGSGHVVGTKQLDRMKYDDATQVINAVPGVYSRGEDGVGLRPNIGMRGANPDRSKKVTLLEDGIPFGPAPYSAPAAYYFPLVARMSQVRVLKGPAGLVYGPQTIGGAIDFITRPIPKRPTASVDLAGGEYRFGKAHVVAGATEGKLGLLVEGLHLRSDGFKHLPDGGDTGFARNEWMIKGAYELTPRQSIGLKLSYADEVSNETYLGITDEDFRVDPDQRYSASAADQMRNHRKSLVFTHVFEPSETLTLTTSYDHSNFVRTWSKANAFRGASLFDVISDPDSPRNAVFMDVLRNGNSTSSAEALLIGPNARDFQLHGLQSVLHWDPTTGPVAHKVESGLRLHYDGIERRHSQDAFMLEAGKLVSDGTATDVTSLNNASTQAAAFHVMDSATWRKLTVTGGVRVEAMRSKFVDHKADTEHVRWATAILPSIGAFYGFTESFGVLAGVYQGFSPPAPGTDETIEPERSTNYEAGARLTWRRTSAEIIGYFNDYSNLTDVCTMSSGCVDENLDRQFDAGEAHIYGVEAALKHEFRVAGFRLPLSGAYTLTQTAFLNDFDSQDPIYGRVTAGDELPYVPRHQVNASAGVEHRRASLNVSATYSSRMREVAGGEPVSETLSTDAQFVVDVSGSVKLLRWLDLYANVRNVANERFIVSRRPYGARPNAPRWAQVGVKATY